jgi:hypothetical protein
LTEFKDTLDHPVGKLKDWGFRVGCIHGSMRIGSRDDSGSRLEWTEVVKVAHYRIDTKNLT